jgi:serine phosphatase RsbU (regulator of sigma subunit)
MFLVQPFPRGVMVALVDGIGHGDEAVAAARLACDTLKAHAEEPVIDLVRRCHQELKETRGVVLTLASLHAGEGWLTWLGVGNVEGSLIQPVSGSVPKVKRVLLRGGLVGLQLPSALHPGTVEIHRGDLLVLASDGIRPEFADHITEVDSPQRTADWVLTQFDKGTDDALVVAVRYLGGADE